MYFFSKDQKNGVVDLIEQIWKEKNIEKILLPEQIIDIIDAYLQEYLLNQKNEKVKNNSFSYKFPSPSLEIKPFYHNEKKICREFCTTRLRELLYKKGKGNIVTDYIKKKFTDEEILKLNEYINFFYRFFCTFIHLGRKFNYFGENKKLFFLFFEIDENTKPSDISDENFIRYIKEFIEVLYLISKKIKLKNKNETN